jgi:hypothetical protein
VCALVLHAGQRRIGAQFLVDGCGLGVLLLAVERGGFGVSALVIFAEGSVGGWDLGVSEKRGEDESKATANRHAESLQAKIVARCSEKRAL